VNAPHVEEDLLQRYFDGDLEAASAATVSSHIESCAQCQQRHLALNELHKLLVFAADQQAIDVDFERAFARIERGTREAPAPGIGERLRIWWRDLIEQRPERLWAPAVGAVMAGALLVFALRDPAPEGGAQRAAAPRPAPATAVPAPPEQPVEGTTIPEDALALASSEVVQVDFGSNAGTVYEIALANGVSTPVVWINDDVIQ